MPPEQPLALPPLDELVSSADAGLHRWVRDRIPAERRRTALAYELDFWVHTAPADLGYARTFAAHAPRIGAPVEAYLDRWLPIDSGVRVLTGPRYLGRDPDLPFVGISASERPLVPSDIDALIKLAHTEFARFRPLFVLFTSAQPVADWPGCRTEKRTVAGRLGDLRAAPLDPTLRTRPRRDLERYERYLEIYRRDQEASRVRRRWASAEAAESIRELADQGLLFDVLVDDSWAGVVAAKIGSRDGVPGAVVQELVLDHPYRGRGLGHQLSTLLARAVPLDDDDFLVGTIHSGNHGAYRSALRAGRVDVGGEILINVDPSGEEASGRCRC